MEPFAQYFSLLLFYIELSNAFWITWILIIENPKIESFPLSADLVMDNIRGSSNKFPDFFCTGI